VIKVYSGISRRAQLEVTVIESMRRVAAALIVSGAVAVLTAPAAAAHIDAKADGATPGGFGVITLGVPTEAGKPATTKVEVRIPDETPMRTVRAEPKPGWSLDIKKRTIDQPLRKDDGTPVTEVVHTVTWTATDGGVPEGQFTEFALYAGPIPDADSLALPTTQTFSDGSTEVWAEAASGGEKPKFPVPSVTITKPASAVLPIVAWSALGLSATALALGVFAIDRAARRPAADGSAGDRTLTPAAVTE
jgi:periplasmic copper chaperone A